MELRNKTKEKTIITPIDANEDDEEEEETKDVFSYIEDAVT